MPSNANPNGGYDKIPCGTIEDNAFYGCNNMKDVTTGYAVNFPKSWPDGGENVVGYTAGFYFVGNKGVIIKKTMLPELGCKTVIIGNGVEGIETSGMSYKRELENNDGETSDNTTTEASGNVTTEVTNNTSTESGESETSETKENTPVGPTETSPNSTSDINPTEDSGNQTT